MGTDSQPGIVPDGSRGRSLKGVKMGKMAVVATRREGPSEKIFDRVMESIAGLFVI